MNASSTAPYATVKPTPSVKAAAAEVLAFDIADYGLDGLDGDISHRMPVEPDKSDTTWTMDAKLWEGKFDQGGRLREHRVRRYTTKAAVLDEHKRLREAGMTEADYFAYGGDQARYGAHEPRLTAQFTPLIPGPYTRQQYWSEYFETSAKCFEAYQHNALAHRAVELAIEFVLGRGVQARCSDENTQKVWDEFWQANDMDERLAQIMRWLGVCGEVFLRYFPPATAGGPLQVRDLDPAEIYDIATDQEDREAVYFYHQQFATRMQLFAPPAGDLAPSGPTKSVTTRYIIRQIPAGEVDHYRVNAVGSEVRGRPDLFPALAHLKRLRDLVTARVVRADLQARMALHMKVTGNGGDVTSIKNKIFPQGRIPAPATVIATNDNVDLLALQFAGSSDTSTATDIGVLLELIAMGVGVPTQYLGISGGGQGSGGSRATALVATEPAAKRFDTRQRLAERILQRMAERVFDAARITDLEKREIEFIFPAIATEDRHGKMQDLAFARSMNWISAKTAATSAAKELDMTTYDFEQEQEAIIEEWAAAHENDGDEGGEKWTPEMRRSMINATFRQAPMLDPTETSSGTDDEPPGLLVPVGADGKPAPSTGSGAPSQTTAGFPADENPLSQAGAANIRKDNALKERRVVLTEAQFSHVLREVAVAAAKEARAPRRKPDDPEFTRAAEEFKAKSREHLAELVS